MDGNKQYEENRLLQEMAAGDQCAFEEIYQHYHSNLYHYILRIVKSPPLAEDLKQEVFVKVWEIRQQLPEVRAFGSFLFSIARNHTINMLKSLSRTSAGMGEILRYFPEPGYDDEILSRDYARYVQKVLQSLPERTREIYRKCREQGKTYDEVAGELGISKNAVKRHMVNSLRMLKDSAGRDLELPPELI
jgi:RNA polymerase sigma-70 factor (family 1)